MKTMDKQQLRQFRAALVETDVSLTPDDPRYVPGLHGTPEEDVISALFEEILTRPALDSHLFYFTGQRGTGKSTELRRLEQLLQAESAQVIRFDSLDFITETEKVTVESILLLVTAGLAAWADENYKQDFLTAGAWTRFSDWLKTEVELTDVSAHGLKLKLKEHQVSVAEKIRNLSTPLEWTKKVQTFAGEIIEFVRQRTHRERIVIIVDSLERLRGVSGSDQDSMFQHVITAFAGDFDRLRIPGASVVYSIPPYLALLADVRNFVTCHALASVRVYEKPVANGKVTDKRRKPRPEGLEKMRRLIERRYPEWASVLAAPALDALAQASGGDLRHFMQRLVSGVVGKAQFALDRLPLGVEDALVQQVIDENRGETERLTVKSEWPLLADIARSHNAIAADRGDSLRTLARLFDTRVILNYRNGAEWFDIHPLLWSLIDDLDEQTKNTAS
jgi:energy-coupling factor transporter ATP-binding protein EcfA2